jgi:hypothetical protein
MVVHKRVMVETTTALLRNGPLLLITGMVGLVAGLAMVLGHDIWSWAAFSAYASPELLPDPSCQTLRVGLYLIRLANDEATIYPSATPRGY